MYSLDGEHLKHSLQLSTLRFIVAIFDFDSTLNLALKRKFKVLNKRIIIQAMISTWDGCQYYKQLARKAQNPSQNKGKPTKGQVTYQLWFLSVCVRHNLDNNTFSNMPGCIESARQTSSCCPCNSPSSLRGQVAHRATPLHHGKTSWRPGWTYEPVGDAIMCMHVARKALQCTCEDIAWGKSCLCCRYKKE